MLRLSEERWSPDHLLRPPDKISCAAGEGNLQPAFDHLTPESAVKELSPTRSSPAFGENRGVVLSADG